MRGRLFNPKWRRGRLFLPYGIAADQTASVYMNTVDGVAMNASRGYVMPAGGWIVGHAVTFDVTVSSSGILAFKVRINTTEQTMFTHTVSPAVVNDNQTATVRSRSARFAAGDRIALLASVANTCTFGDVAGLIEVELER